MGTRGEVYSSRFQAKSEKRTYFFNVKENRFGDLFVNIVESKKHDAAAQGMEYERHQIVVFKEDMPEFLRSVEKVSQFMNRR